MISDHKSVFGFSQRNAPLVIENNASRLWSWRPSLSKLRGYRSYVLSSLKSPDVALHPSFSDISSSHRLQYRSVASNWPITCSSLIRTKLNFYRFIRDTALCWISLCSSASHGDVHSDFVKALKARVPHFLN